MWMIGCVRCEKTNCKYFRTKRGQNGLPWPIFALFFILNKNPKTALNMSFGSNGDDWVCPLRKNQLQVFSYQTWPDWSSLADFRTIFRSRIKNAKAALNMSFWSNGDDWLHSLRKNQLQVFSYRTWPERHSPTNFHTIFCVGTKTLKPR